MFDTARTYNQEGSWVYIDAEEMEKVFEAAYDRHVANAGFPGFAGGVASSSGYDAMDDDEPIARPRAKSANIRKAVISDDDYSSDDD
jgi:ATP-dependent helicase STH1/SNF2